MNYLRYMVRDPKICGGEAVIKGTRVTVRTILASLAEGATIEEILDDFPSLSEEQVRAVIAFAAASAGGRHAVARDSGTGMRIKLDENMPAALAKALAGLGHDVETVPQEGLTGRPDG